MSDISGVNSSIVQSQLAGLQIQQLIGYKVAAKALDMERTQGAAVLQLLDSALQVTQSDNSASPTLGQIDSGRGQNLDVYA